MSTLIELQIKTKMANIAFSDDSKVIERSSEIIIKEGDIGFSIDISGIDLVEANQVRDLVMTELQKIPDISKINIVLTSSESKQKTQKDQSSKIILDNIDKVICLAAGKGGVGKSTISALLAQKLAAQGKKVGLLDADIYGPSIPNIFALSNKPEVLNKRMIPLCNHNVKINSIGFITDPLSSISWRGPMTSKALYQLISLTDWGTLDYLIIDTPPGTGDIHLSLLQNYLVFGVIMLTTPQKISAIDVHRAINLYQKFGVPPIGIIENMSYYTPPNSSERINIFSGDSGNQISIDYNIPLLTRIALNTGLAKACDAGNALDKYFDLLDFKI
ncbi:MAG: Mrp/NBP35 family ATP-binding protein [Rickettsiaceae bacterium]